MARITGFSNRLTHQEITLARRGLAAMAAQVNHAASVRVSGSKVLAGPVHMHPAAHAVYLNNMMGPDAQKFIRMVREGRLDGVSVTGASSQDSLGDADHPPALIKGARLPIKSATQRFRLDDFEGAIDKLYKEIEKVAKSSTSGRAYVRVESIKQVRSQNNPPSLPTYTGELSVLLNPTANPTRYEFEIFFIGGSQYLAIHRMTCPKGLEEIAKATITALFETGRFGLSRRYNLVVTNS